MCALEAEHGGEGRGGAGLVAELGLVRAAQEGDGPAVSRLLALGADPNAFITAKNVAIGGRVI